MMPLYPATDLHPSLVLYPSSDALVTADGYLTLDSLTIAPGLHPGNDATVRAAGLKDQDGEAVAAATVTASLMRGTEEVWSSAMDADGAGDYSVGLPDGLTLTLGEVLRLVVTAESGDVDAEWSRKFRVRKRIAPAA